MLDGNQAMASGPVDEQLAGADNAGYHDRIAR